jgi:hypothetical protein
VEDSDKDFTEEDLEEEDDEVDGGNCVVKSLGRVNVTGGELFLLPVFTDDDSANEGDEFDELILMLELTRSNIEYDIYIY